MPFSEAKRKALIDRLTHLHEGVPHDYLLTYHAPSIHNETAKKIIDKLELADPTATGKYGNWLLEEWLDDSFRLGEDLEAVYNTLVAFEQVKRDLEDRDINHYTLYDLRELIEAYVGPADASTTRQALYWLRTGKMSPEAMKSLLLYDMPPWSVIRTTSPEIASALAQDTAWCVQDPETAVQYLSLAPLYFILKNEKPYALYYSIGDTTRRGAIDMVISGSPVLPYLDEQSWQQIATAMNETADRTWGDVPVIRDLRDRHDRPLPGGTITEDVLRTVGFDADIYENDGMIKNLVDFITQNSTAQKQAITTAVRIGVDMTNIDLHEVNLRTCDLRKARLNGANFTDAVLDYAHLDEAQLDGAVFHSAYANFVCFNGASLIGTNFSKTYLGGETSFVGADLSDATLPNWRANADFTDARMSGVNARGTDFMHSNFDGAYLFDADLRGADFSHARGLKSAVFHGAKLDGAIFKPSEDPRNDGV